MKTKSREGVRRSSLASGAVAAFMLLSVSPRDVTYSSMPFPGAQASDLTAVQHGNAIINRYNNDGCIYNIGCHERPIGHFIVSNDIKDIP